MRRLPGTYGEILSDLKMQVGDINASGGANGPDHLAPGHGAADRDASPREVGVDRVDEIDPAVFFAIGMTQDDKVSPRTAVVL